MPPLGVHGQDSAGSRLFAVGASGVAIEIEIEVRNRIRMAIRNRNRNRNRIDNKRASPNGD
ncbi:hypothetical protein BGX26_006492, partial [Mortierella sp. AD094]